MPDQSYPEIADAEYDALAKSNGWVLLKRGWYHPFADQFYAGACLYPRMYATAKELCDKERLGL